MSRVQRWETAVAGTRKGLCGADMVEDRCHLGSMGQGVLSAKLRRDGNPETLKVDRKGRWGLRNMFLVAHVENDGAKAGRT